MSEENNENDNVIGFPDVLKHKQALQQYLEEHPELWEYQEKIDAALERAGSNPQNRLAVISQMFAEKKKELLENMLKLRAILEKVRDAHKEK